MLRILGYALMAVGAGAVYFGEMAGGQNNPDADEPQGEWHQYQHKRDQPDVSHGMEDNRFR